MDINKLSDTNLIKGIGRECKKEKMMQVTRKPLGEKEFLVKLDKDRNITTYNILPFEILEILRTFEVEEQVFLAKRPISRARTSSKIPFANREGGSYSENGKRFYLFDTIIVPPQEKTRTETTASIRIVRALNTIANKRLNRIVDGHSHKHPGEWAEMSGRDKKMINDFRYSAFTIFDENAKKANLYFRKNNPNTYNNYHTLALPEYAGGRTELTEEAILFDKNSLYEDETYGRIKYKWPKNGATPSHEIIQAGKFRILQRERFTFNIRDLELEKDCNHSFHDIEFYGLIFG